MDLDIALRAKSFFRFTGPPEHWLTAIKFMTWGLVEDLRERWARIRPGDIFFIHSTGSTQSAFRNAKSGIIGLGVIGPSFSEKQNPLWYDETFRNENKWPLLVPLSEIYLFSEIPAPNTWENPTPNNRAQTEQLIDVLLANCIPLKQIAGFPQMGSFSAVSQEVANKILYDRRPLYLYTEYEEMKLSDVANSKEIDGERIDRQLDEIKNADEALRYADTLKIFDSVKTRIIKEPLSQYVRNNEILDRANFMHSTILQQLIDLFRKHGYDTRSSRTVDLFAHNESNAFLFEVKSTENSNFRTQARKGIAQLFEYEYFDVRKFAKDNKYDFVNTHKLIVPSQQPQDIKYVEFINSLKIGVTLVDENRLKPVGKDFGFSIL